MPKVAMINPKRLEYLRGLVEKLMILVEKAMNLAENTSWPCTEYERRVGNRISHELLAQRTKKHRHGSCRKTLESCGKNI